MEISPPSSPAPRTDSATWRLAVKDTCVGTGICNVLAQRYFLLGEDEKSHPIAGEVPADEVIGDAAASCPMEAILVTDASTGEALEF